MRRKRFPEEQIIGILKEAEAGGKTTDCWSPALLTDQGPGRETRWRPHDLLPLREDADWTSGQGKRTRVPSPWSVRAPASRRARETRLRALFRGRRPRVPSQTTLQRARHALARLSASIAAFGRD